MWERVAEINPRYFDWARQYYRRFQSAYERRPEPRYAELARWTADRLRRKEIVDAVPPPPPVQTVEDLILEGRESESKSNSPLANAEAHAKYTAAIKLLDEKLNEKETISTRTFSSTPSFDAATCASGSAIALARAKTPGG